MTAGDSKAALTITPQPALAPSPQPRPAPTARALPPGLVAQVGQNWTPIVGQNWMPIDTVAPLTHKLSSAISAIGQGRPDPTGPKWVRLRRSTGRKYARRRGGRRGRV